MPHRVHVHIRSDDQVGSLVAYKTSLWKAPLDIRGREEEKHGSSAHQRVRMGIDHPKMRGGGRKIYGRSDVDRNWNSRSSVNVSSFASIQYCVKNIGAPFPFSFLQKDFFLKDEKTCVDLSAAQWYVRRRQFKGNGANSAWSCKKSSQQINES